MKRKIFELIFVLLFIFVMLFNMVSFSVSSFGYDMQDLPKGKLLHPVLSPDTKYTLQLYLIEIKNIGTAIRGEVISADGDFRKNVYWETHTSTAIGGWIDEDTVSINGTSVDIFGKPFDSRTQIILPKASRKNK